MATEEIDTLAEHRVRLAAELEMNLDKQDTLKHRALELEDLLNVIDKILDRVEVDEERQDNCPCNGKNCWRGCTKCWKNKTPPCMEG